MHALCFIHDASLGTALIDLYPTAQRLSWMRETCLLDVHGRAPDTSERKRRPRGSNHQSSAQMEESAGELSNESAGELSNESERELSNESEAELSNESEGELSNELHC